MKTYLTFDFNMFRSFLLKTSI